MNDSVIYLTPMKKKLTEEVIVFLLCEWQFDLLHNTFHSSLHRQKGNSLHIKKILKQFRHFSQTRILKVRFFFNCYIKKKIYQNEIPRKSSTMDNDFYHGNECFLPELSCAVFVRWRLYTRKYYRVWNIASYTGTKEPVREKLPGTSQSR